MVFNILNELICKWMGKACHFLIKERGGSCMNNKIIIHLREMLFHCHIIAHVKKCCIFINYKQRYATSLTI